MLTKLKHTLVAPKQKRYMFGLVLDLKPFEASTGRNKLMCKKFTTNALLCVLLWHVSNHQLVNGHLKLHRSVTLCPRQKTPTLDLGTGW